MKQSFITQDFAAPHHCKELALAGVIKFPVYRWRLECGSWKLWTYEFDPDYYYQEGDLLINKVEPFEEIPALSMMDLERCVPDYFIERMSNGFYQLICDMAPDLEPVRHPRLPDVFAVMILQMIKKKHYPVGYFNQRLVSRQ